HVGNRPVLHARARVRPGASGPYRLIVRPSDSPQLQEIIVSDQHSMSELPKWIQERIRNSAVSQLSEPMRIPRVCPVCMADPIIDSEAKYRQFMAGTEATPGRD